MEQNTVIIVAESDHDQYQSIERNLKRTSLGDKIKRFDNAKTLAEFLFTPQRHPASYILILDINIKGLDGMELLRKIKSDSFLKRMPVVIFTAQQDQKTIDRCHELGCSIYVSKPGKVAAFADTVYNIAKFLLTIKVPRLNSEQEIKNG